MVGKLADLGGNGAEEDGAIFADFDVIEAEGAEAWGDGGGDEFEATGEEIDDGDIGEIVGAEGTDADADGDGITDFGDGDDFGFGVDEFAKDFEAIGEGFGGWGLIVTGFDDLVESADARRLIF